MNRHLVISLLALLFALPAAAQKFPERRLVRAGNRDYEREHFVESQIAYRRALEKTPESYEAAYNLGKALYKQERWDEAAQLFGPLAADSLHRGSAPSAYYDAGNALFRQRKLQEALEAYKQSLRLDPTDMEAKFNLAYVQKLLEDQQDNKDQNDQQQDQEQDQEQQPQGGENQPQEADPQQSEGGMSRQEAEQMLEAMQVSEQRTRERKEGEEKKAVVSGGGKNW